MHVFKFDGEYGYIQISTRTSFLMTESKRLDILILNYSVAMRHIRVDMDGITKWVADCHPGNWSDLSQGYHPESKR